MNAQHRLNRRSNRARRIQRRIAEATADRDANASQPVTVARLDAGLVQLRRSLQQYAV